MDEASILSLPDDPALLKRMLAERTHERDEHRAARQQIELHIQQVQSEKQQIELDKKKLELAKQAAEFKLLRVEVELLRYKKWYYGPRADRLVSLGEVNQLLLAFGQDLEARPIPQEVPESTASAVTPEESAAEPPTHRIRRGRRDLAAFEHLPVSRQVYDLS